MYEQQWLTFVCMPTYVRCLLSALTYLGQCFCHLSLYMHVRATCLFTLSARQPVMYMRPCCLYPSPSSWFFVIARLPAGNFDCQVCISTEFVLARLICLCLDTAQSSCKDAATVWLCGAGQCLCVGYLSNNVLHSALLVITAAEADSLALQLCWWQLPADASRFCKT